MKARARNVLFNAGPPGSRVALMDDDQRKAMFARLHGGGRGGGRAYSSGGDEATYAGTRGSKRSGTASSGGRSYDSRVTMHPEPSIEGPDAYEARVATERASKLKEAAKRLDEIEAEYADVINPDTIYPVGYGSVGPTAAKSLGGILTAAAKKAGTSLSAYAIGHEIGRYRNAHPELSPRLDHYLAMTEDLAYSVSVMSALSVTKKGVKSVLPKNSLAGLTRISEAIATWWAKSTPTLSKVLASPKKWYDAIADFTGSELPVFRNLGRLGKMTADEKKAALAKAAYASLLAGGVEAYETHKIGEYKDAMTSAWDKGESYRLPADYDPFEGDYFDADQAAKAGGIFLAGTLGNPIEKQFRNYFSGKLTKNLADRAEYELKHDRITKALEEGYYTEEEARAEYEALAERKPWGTSGSALYSITPAVVGLTKYYAGKVSEIAKRPTRYVTVSEKQVERDADTFRFDGGGSIRYLGGDSTEIAHAFKPGSKDEPMSREATARARELAPEGSTVRLTAGGEGGFETDKYGRTLARVERIPSLVAKIPGVRKVWPATDSMTDMLATGLAQPRYEELGSDNFKSRSDRKAAVEAYEKKLGVYDPDVRAKMQSLGLYTWTPSAKDYPTAAQKLSDVGNIAGVGLLGTGQSGIATKLGKLGTPTMQAWNAGMAALGTAQYIVGGPKNTGYEYKPPKQKTTAQLKSEKAQAARKAAVAKKALEKSKKKKSQ